MLASAVSVNRFVQRFNASIDDTTEEEKREVYRALVTMDPEIHTFMQQLDKEVNEHLKEDGVTPRLNTPNNTKGMV